MRMKKKIRQSFEKAAPDVLGRVLQELPEQKKSQTPRQTAPVTPKKYWLKEFASTAAAFLLLIAVAGGAVWYFTHGGLSPAAGPNDPTGDPNVTRPSATEPVDPRPEIYLEDLDYMAENILYPWYLRDSVYEEPEVKTPLDCQDDVYILSKTLGSYSYEFCFDSYSGKLLGLDVVDCTNENKEFIPETVAEAIALLNAQLTQGETVSADHCQLVKTNESGYYCITVSGMEQLSTAIYYIHANSGKLLTLGDEVEPGYTVGPPEDPFGSEDTTPPDGMIPEDVAVKMAMQHACVEECSSFCVLDDGLKAYIITLDDGKYIYELTIDAYSGEVLAFPVPTLKENVDIPPDGRITGEMAIEAALENLGVSRDKAENLNCAEESDRFRITFDLENTHFVIYVDAYNPSKIFMEKFEAAGANLVQARWYALDYIGVGIEHVRALSIQQPVDQSGFLVQATVDDVRYDVALDRYGEVLGIEKIDVGLPADEALQDVIGWQAARDIWLDVSGTSLYELVAFSYEYIPEDQYPARYRIYTEDLSEPVCTVIATTGKVFSESDTDYGTPILALDDITQIALMDLDPQIRENYIAGAYDECFIDARVYYSGGAWGNAPQFYYEWNLHAGNIWCVYQIDAITGQILMKDMDVKYLVYALFDVPGSWYNMALNCQFSDPSEIDLSTFFYNGFPEESRVPTQQELLYLQELEGYQAEADLIRLPARRMNEVLEQYFGITLEDMQESCFEGLLYLESTDCYYMMHTDALAAENFTVVDIHVEDNGNVIVQYSIVSWEKLQMKLTPWGTGYRIVYNKAF